MKLKPLLFTYFVCVHFHSWCSLNHSSTSDLMPTQFLSGDSFVSSAITFAAKDCVSWFKKADLWDVKTGTIFVVSDSNSGGRAVNKCPTFIV